MLMTLQTTFIGLSFQNPFLLASAPPTTSRDMIARAFEAGWGGAVIKTLAQVEPHALTNVTPRIRAVRSGHAGRIMGFANVELGTMKRIEDWLEDMAALKRGFPDRVLVASMLYGGAPVEAQWRDVARQCGQAGADALELNFSCPHGGAEEGGLSAIANRENSIRQVLGWVRASTSLPILVKLPVMCDLDTASRAAAEAGADAVTVINTINSLPGIDIETFAPLLAVDGKGAFGGLSGPAVKPIALRCVAQVRKACPLPVSGVGGVSDWHDAVEFFLAGAGTVQVCSEVMRRGYGVIDDLCAGTARWLERKGFARLEDAVGLALPHIVPHRELRRDWRVRAVCTAETCRRCGLCAVSCRDAAYQAITWEEGATPRVNAEQCDGCGLCVQICPTGSMVLVARD